MTPSAITPDPGDCLENALPGFGRSLWEAGLESQFDAFRRARKENFTYEVRLRDLVEPLSIPLLPDPELEPLMLMPDAYRGLDVEIEYKFVAAEPAESYSVGCVFNPDDLPTFFSDENFLLREVVAISGLPHLADPLNVEYEEGRAVADAVFHVRASLDGQQLEPEEDDIFSDKGIRWRYRLADAQRDLLRNRGATIAISVRTYQAVSQKLFPFAVTAPTRNPRVVFDYAEAPTIESVHVETFFTARKPFDASRGVEPPFRRIVVQPLGDWALIGNGCVFTW